MHGASIINKVVNLGRRAVNAVCIRIGAAAAVMTARRTTLANLRRAPVQRVLVVCYGNIYRSAFVGALLQDQLGATHQVRSGGFHHKAGRPSPERHVQSCRRFGVSLEAHRSAVVTADDVRWADVIVLMDRHNWARLRALGANVEKLVWLGSLIPGSIEIADPYTADDDEAERIVQRLHAASIRLVAGLRGEPMGDLGSRSSADTRKPRINSAETRRNG
jgi:protein-tyrosine phosphatase